MHPVTSNAVANSLSYSTEETLTGGTWIDGKPIYRTTFNWNYSINAGDDYSYTVDIGQADFDTWIKTYYVGTRTNSTDKMTASFDTWTSNNFTAIKIWNSSKSAMHVDYIIFEYTKKDSTP